MANDTQQTYQQATYLIKTGMRVALVHSLTGTSLRILRDLWKDHHAEDQLPGRMPSSTAAYIKIGQPTTAIATVVAIYLSYEDMCSTPASAFISAWKAASLLGCESPQLDINAAWFCIRDIKAGLLNWCICTTCTAGYFFVAAETRKKTKCVFCGSQKNHVYGAAKCS